MTDDLKNSLLVACDAAKESGRFPNVVRVLESLAEAGSDVEPMAAQAFAMQIPGPVSIRVQSMSYDEYQVSRSSCEGELVIVQDVFRGIAGGGWEQIKFG